jgi:probable rRNA maturation factor
MSQSPHRKRPGVRIDISGSRASYVGYIKAKLRQAHPLMKSKLEELSVAIVNDRLMSQLHQYFMGIAGPTDVLSFTLEFNSRRQPITGEVVICLPEARRQSRKLGTKLRNELLLYALHGMLHLSGFDDRTDRQYRRMHLMEDTILSQLGAGPVFSVSAAPSRKSRRKGCRRCH